jgi:hypothetical protein
MSNVKPALTELEWSTLGFRRVVDEESNDLQAAKIENGNVYREHDENVDEWQRLEHPHAMAALCLYGQPFGISQQDIQLLRYVAPLCDMKEDYDAVIALADKLAALLPPSDPTRAQDE